MARPKIKRKGLDWKELLKEEKDFLKAAIEEVVQEVLEAEMDEVSRPTRFGTVGELDLFRALESENEFDSEKLYRRRLCGNGGKAERSWRGFSKQLVGIRVVCGFPQLWPFPQSFSAARVHFRGTRTRCPNQVAGQPRSGTKLCRKC